MAPSQRLHIIQRIAQRSGDLRKVFALQAALAAAIGGREPSLTPWAEVVPAASLLRVCSVILGLLADCEPGAAAPAVGVIHLASCASVLDVLSGGAGIWIAQQPATVADPVVATADLHAIARVVWGRRQRWLVDEAVAVGGAFAAGVAEAVEHAHLSQRRAGEPYMDGLPPTRRQRRVVKERPRLADWYAALLADPALQKRLAGLRGQQRRRLLKAVMRQAFDLAGGSGVTDPTGPGLDAMKGTFGHDEGRNLRSVATMKGPTRAL